MNFNSKPEVQVGTYHIQSSGNFQGRILKLISVICRWCNIGFCVCQCCWRGQAYCSDTCRRDGYRKSHRKAQQRYRQTEKGKKAHRLAENRRRYRKTSPASKNMDDDTSNHPLNVQIRKAREENLAKLHRNFIKCCHFCGRLGEIVSKFARRRYGNHVFEEDFQPVIQEKWQ